MAGFAKVTVVGNAGGQDIVNVFWYRSDTWNPLGGNPFTEMLEMLLAFQELAESAIISASNGQYVLQRYEGVGYDDAMVEVPGSFNTLTVQRNGTLDGGAMDSYALTANITWRCGVQHQIDGIGQSKRNRGTTSWGPVASTFVSDDGHFTGTFVSTVLNNLANVLKQRIFDVPAFATMVPIRMHHARTLGVQTGRTYSDILGYALPTRVSFRRSRLPEA